MTDFNPYGLKRGHGILCKFGRRGHQYALVHSVTPSLVKVVKWRAVSRTWTKPVKLWPSEVVRRANVGEFKTTAVPASIWGSQ